MDSRTPPSSRASGSPLSSRASEARRGISSPRLAIVLLAALLLGTLAAGTQALAASPTGQDTDFTPIPKDGRNFGWTQFDGATFGRGGDLVPNSQTPFTVDFFNVRFDPDPEKGDGLAGGAACADSETPFDKLGSCERVPAIWQFKDSSWQQVALPGGAGSGDPKPGYVGAIAYMADGNVLAVGGDGVYPRRESSTPVDAPDYTDPAGKARAWLYDGSAWKEVSDQFGSIAMDGGETPGGLSALDCANHTRDTSFWNAGSLYGGEDCVAGGLHQLWMWQDGGIAKTYDDQSTSGWTNKLCANVEAGGGFTGGGSFFCTFSQSVGLFGLDPVQVPPLRDGPADSASGSTAPDFRFRVREIRWTGSEGSDRWAAVTAGCCSESPGATNGRVDATGPRVLLNDGSRWSAGTLNEPDLATVSGGGLASAGLADSYYSVTPSYSSANGNPALFSLSLVASPGGPAADGTGDPAGGGEPGARLIWDRRKAPAGQNDSADNADLLSLRLGGVRLVSADGDFTGPSGGHAAVSGAGAVGPDGLLDWAVGSLTSPATCESPGLASTCQGVAYTTLRQTQLTPSPLTCTPTKGFDSSTCGPSKDATGARYATEAAARDQSSQELMSLPSYALNSFTNVPNTAGDVAWAVGDKGAILRLGGKGTVGSPKEPTAPQLGAPRQVAIADRSAYEEGRPPATTGEVGPVPPLAARPLGRGEPSLIPVGSADPNGVSGFRHPNSIAMSRDGSEGWASAGGSQGSPTTLAHYSAGTWTVCDATGIAGQLPADRACSDLVQQFGGHISLRTLSRLPLENDSDPANDDEFEVMALGDDSIALYRDGRWSRADQSLVGDLLGSTPETGVVFSAPDDGWLVTDDHPDGTELHHFDGTRWTRCGTSAVNSSPPTHPELCGDPARRLPLFKAGLQGKLYLAVAGERVYLAGTRAIKPNQAAAVPLAGAVANSTAKGTPYPVIYHHDPGGEWTADYDPGCESRSDPSTQGCLGSSDSAKQGSLTAFSVAQLSGGRFAGWAAGTFGAPATPRAGDLSYTQGAAGPTPGLLRLDPSVGSWRMWPRGDASSDYLVSPDGIGTNSAARIRLLTVAAADGEERSLLIPDQYATLNRPPILEYGGGRDRWQALPTPFLATDKFSAIEHYATGFLEALAPDGTGGLWLAVGGFGHFYHYTDRHPEPVFTDAPDPIREPIVATAAGADASFWVATTSNSVYRYDRVTGWDRMTIPGWDRGRLVTNPSAAAAIAFGADGSGVLVGKGGRIADLSSGGGVLDAAAGVLCSATQNVAPCGTSYYLRAAGVAPDGSAIVGGDHMALLWRPGHGRFRSITKPREKSADTTITGISMPSPDRAWLTTDAGQVFAGTLNGEGDWSWKLAAGPSTLTAGSRGEPLPIHAIALDSSGRGLAVGDGGLILQSDGHGSWQRLDTGRLDDLYSVALSPGGYGDGTLIGGGVGLVLTRIGGRFEVARPSDLYNGLTSGWGNNNASRTIGVAVLPGYKAGEVEAWAATQMFDVPVQQQFRPAPFPGALLHYTNAPSKLLDGGVGRVPSLSDAPAPRSVDISFVAFGKQECQIPDEPTCPEMQGSNLVNEVISRRVGSLLTGITPPSTDLIPGATAGADKAAFAVFTGDAGSSGGRDQGGEQTGISHQGVAPNAPIDTDVIHHRWSELVAQPLQDAGVPLFGALGGQDLSQTSACSYLGRSCPSTRQVGNPGPNLPWREAMSAMPAPWGAQKLADGSENKPPPGSGGYDFVPVPASGQESPAACSPAADTPSASVGEQKSGDQTVSGQSVAQNHIDPQCASAGGAHTHYAVDVLRNGTPAMRLVVVDTSLKTLSGIAATQNPVEEQLKWLTDVLASRPEGERAVIVTETPAYSYGPGGVTDTLTDSTSFEALIAREGVDAVISGRLGWNGLFYTIAPGVHSPCPGGAYPAEAPKSGQPPCAPAGSGAPGTPVAPSGAEIADAAAGAGAPLPDTAKDALGSADSLTSAIPNVVAASAGGRFGPRGDSTGPASEGYWHGYSVIRVPTGQDQGPVLVEQRPVLDWVGVSAAKHVLRPHQRVELSGYGREPVGMDVPIRYDEISTPAITHCYDLVWADQDKPWLALLAKDASDQQLAAAGTGCHARFLDSGAASARNDSGAKTNPCDPYVCLDPAIARLTDDQQGKIEAGSGEHERTFALAMLSVGKLSATYPLVFEPRPSFTNQSIPPSPPPVPVSAPAPSNPPSGQAPPINVAGPPAPPALPLGASLSATTPPAVPLPPNNTTPELNLFTSPISISVAPSLSLFPPAPPVINVAPPTPARPRQEAKKAAVQSSGSEADNPGSSEAQNLGGDLAGSSDTTPGSAMTRHENSATRRDRIAPAQSFTPLAHHNQPSAWARDLQWGGGLTLMALVFAFGWITVRPTPRRRQPEVPAPAEARIRQRR